jgi:hypothetical protein
MARILGFTYSLQENKGENSNHKYAETTPSMYGVFSLFSIYVHEITVFTYAQHSTLLN